MKKIIFIFAFLVTVLLLPLDLSAQKKDSLAVFPFNGESTSDGEAISASFARQSSLQNSFNRIRPVNRNTIAALNFEQQFQRNSGLTDADTIFELEKALNASHVIAGYITKLGNRNLLIVSIMDVESLQQIAGDYRPYQIIDDIIPLIPEMAQKLATAVMKDTRGLPGLSVPSFNISNTLNNFNAMVLAQILACDMANFGKYAILPRTDSLDAVRQEHQYQRDGLTNQERIKRLGEGRNAQYVLSGSIETIGSRNRFGVDILDIEDFSIVPGKSGEEYYTNFVQGIEVMPKLAMQLSGIPIPLPKIPLYEQLVSATGTTTILVTEDTLLRPITISKATSITLKGDTDGRTIENSDTKYYGISIERGVTLIIENLTLKSSIFIKSGGTLVINNSANITNSTGVRVEGGTLLMNSGAITNNSSNGVWVNESGKFTMNGGIISNNKSHGVQISKNSIFSMKNGRIENHNNSGVLNWGDFYMSGGIITGNNDANLGGGVKNWGNFYMSGGTISNNRSKQGGGVWSNNSGAKFNKTGGVIYGSNASSSNANKAGGQGDAVYDDSAVIVRKNNTQ